MSKETRADQKRCVREIRRLERSVVRKEARIPFYLEMINSVNSEQGSLLGSAKDKFERELEQLLSELEEERCEIGQLKESSLHTTHELKLRLLKGLAARPGTPWRYAVVCGLASALILVFSWGIARRVLKATPARRALSAAVAIAPLPSLSADAPTPVIPRPQAVAVDRSSAPTPHAIPPTLAKASPPEKPVPPAASGVAEQAPPPASLAPPHPPRPPAPSPIPAEIKQSDFTDPDPSVRWRALDRLAMKDPQGCVQSALQLATDTDPRLRGRAAAALASSDESEASQTLKALSQDPEPYVRLIAQDALRRIQERREQGT